MFKVHSKYVRDDKTKADKGDPFVINLDRGRLIKIADCLEPKAEGDAVIMEMYQTLLDEIY